jgi:DNA primase
MALDSDSSGLMAMKRINEMALAEGIIPKILTLGEFKDPDEFLKNRGAVALQERLVEAKTFIDYKIDKIIPKIIPELSDKKLQILEQIFDLLSPLKDDLRATERVLSAAKRLKLQSDPSQIINTYNSYLTKNQPLNGKTTPSTPVVKEQKYFEDEKLAPTLKDEYDHNKTQIEDISKVEKIFLREIVIYPELLTLSAIDELLDFVVHNDVKRYVLRLKELIYEIDESDYSSVMNSIVSNGNYLLSLKETVGGALYRYRPVSLEEKVLSRLVNDLKIKLQLEQLKQKRDNLKMKQKDCDTEETLAVVMRELLLIQQDIEKLKSPQQSK